MIESFFRMKSTAKQEHNLNFKRNSYIPKMCVDPWPVGSTTKPTLKVCEHNRVTHASMAPDKGHLEELGWITCVAWRKQRREENRQDSMHRSQGSTYRSPIKHDTHVIGPGWTLGINLIFNCEVINAGSFDRWWYLARPPGLALLIDNTTQCK